MPLSLATIQTLLVKLHDGLLDKVEIARLPNDVISSLDARFPIHTVSIHIDKYILHKILMKGVSISDVANMQNYLDVGLTILEKNRPNSFILSVQNTNQTSRYKAAFKVAQHGHEIWVSSFHETRPRQTKALIARGYIIRKHK